MDSINMEDQAQQQTKGQTRRPSWIFDDIVLPVLAEFVGVCFYSLVSVLGFNSFCDGLAVAAFMVAFSEISGGHLNPAVTLGATIAGKITVKNVVLAIFYFKAQVLGSMLGAAFARAVMDVSWIHNTGVIITTVTVGAGWRILGEGLMTFAWVFIFLMTTMSRHPNGKKVAPFAVGLYVLIGRMVSIQRTGGSMNPALSFGKSVAFTGLVHGVWAYHYVFWVGPLAGGLLASIFYKLFFATSDRRWLFRDRSNTHVSF